MIYPSLEPEARVVNDAQLERTRLVSMRVVASPMFAPGMALSSALSSATTSGDTSLSSVDDGAGAGIALPPPPMFSKTVVDLVRTRARRFSAPRARRLVDEPPEQERSC